MTLSKKEVILILLAVILTAIVVFAINAKVSLLSWGLYGPVNVLENIAIHGYDPVAYSQSNQAIEGQESISMQ